MLQTIIRVALVALGAALHPALARADVLWGVNGHPLTSYPGVTMDEQLRLVGDLGARSYRVDVTHLDRLNQLGALVELGKTRDITILPVLIPPVSLKNDTVDDLYRKSFNFAAAVVRRFHADVPVFELGNELENFAIIQPCEMRDDGTKYPCEWGPAGGVSPLEYYGPRYVKVAAVLRGLSEGARSIGPHIRRAIGSAGWGHVGIFERLKNDGIDWDVTVWHHYEGNPEWALKRLTAFDRPIWITEFNHPYGSSRDGEDGQAHGLRSSLKLLLDLSQRYRIEGVFIYELLDQTYWAPSFEASMGLVRLVKNDRGAWKLGGHKAAYDIIKRVIATEGERVAAARKAAN